MGSSGVPIMLALKKRERSMKCFLGEEVTVKRMNGKASMVDGVY